MGAFRFKQFTLVQSRSAMKVGTDGVILGAWFDTGGPRARILDVGCGTGLIALMAAQRNPSAMIDAIDIDCGSIADTRENIRCSAWPERIHSFCISFQDFSDSTGVLYDRIVSNPPFFMDSLKSPFPERTAARHTDTLTFIELIEGALRRLAPMGILSVILPPAEMEVLVGAAVARGLFPRKVLEIYPVEGRPVKRLAMEFSPGPGSCVTQNLTLEEGERHCYTEEYKNLTKDFYLKF